MRHHATRGSCAQLSAADCAALGERYLDATRVYRDGEAALHRQDAEQLPPHRPHPSDPAQRAGSSTRGASRMACCFSNFKQLFASGQEFTYSLEDIARYYRRYVELMAHWDAVLPGRVLRVAARGRWSPISRARSAHAGLPAGSSSSRSAWSSTRPSAACAPPAPSRCASPSTGRGSTSGAISSPGSGRCGRRSAGSREPKRLKVEELTSHIEKRH